MDIKEKLKMIKDPQLKYSKWITIFNLMEKDKEYTSAQVHTLVKENFKFNAPGDCWSEHTTENTCKDMSNWEWIEREKLGRFVYYTRTQELRELADECFVRPRK